MAYLYAKAVTLVPTHDQRANSVMMRNRRIGCSMSGIIQAMSKLGRRQFLQWCDRGYQYVQKLDRTYSDWLGVPLSIKTTTVKPSGTVSLLAGATPGIHYPHSEYYIRRVRVQNTSPLVQASLDAGYHVEPDAYADDTSVVSFPVHEKHFVKGKEQATVWEQFANAAALQHHWTDNQVSITVTFKPSEVDDLKACLEMFEDKLKGISVLPLADKDHGYVQAPYESITKEQFEQMAARVKPFSLVAQSHDTDDAYCSGDKCQMPLL
jgi:adenosylcobalamin-dependent ribonucleoside-triphosphate reductase